MVYEVLLSDEYGRSYADVMAEPGNMEVYVDIGEEGIVYFMAIAEFHGGTEEFLSKRGVHIFKAWLALFLHKDYLEYGCEEVNQVKEALEGNELPHHESVCEICLQDLYDEDETMVRIMRPARHLLPDVQGNQRKESRWYAHKGCLERLDALVKKFNVETR